MCIQCYTGSVNLNWYCWAVQLIYFELCGCGICGLIKSSICFLCILILNILLLVRASSLFTSCFRFICTVTNVIHFAKIVFKHVQWFLVDFHLNFVLHMNVLQVVYNMNKTGLLCHLFYRELVKENSSTNFWNPAVQYLGPWVHFSLIYPWICLLYFLNLGLDVSFCLGTDELLPQVVADQYLEFFYMGIKSAYTYYLREFYFGCASTECPNIICPKER